VPQGARAHSTRCFHPASLSIIARGRPEQLNGDRRLDVLASSVTDAGLVGLVMAPALKVVDLRKCPHVEDVATVVQSAPERSMKIFIL
jgi:hypothetical protein